MDANDTAMRDDDDRLNMALVIMSISLLFWIIPLVLFLLRLRRDPWLQQCSPTLAFITSASSIFVYMVAIFQSLGSTPCYFNLWIAYSALPINILSLIARSWRLVVLTELQKRILAHQDQGLSIKGAGIQVKQDRFLTRFKFHRRQVADRRFGVIFAFILVLCILCIIILQITSKSPYQLGDPPQTCPLIWTYAPPHLLIILILFFLLPFLLILMNGPGDAFGIRRDLLVTSALIIPLYLFYLVVSFWGVDTLMYTLFSNAIPALIALINHLSAILVPAIRSYRSSSSSNWPCPENARTTTTFTSKTDFHTALLRPERFMELKRIAAAHFAAETTAFLDDLQDLERDYTRTTPDQSMYIFRQYITPGSIMEIAISNRAREETSHMIAMGLCGISVFAEARVEIEELVCLNFFPKLR